MNTSEALNIKTKMEKDQREKANFFNNIISIEADAAAAAKQVDFLKRKEEIIEEQAHLRAQEAARQAQLKAQEEARQAKVEAALSTLKQRAKAEKLITRAQVLEQGLKESYYTFRSEEIEEEDPMMKVSSYLIQQSSNFGEVTADSEEFRVTEHLAAAESAELMSQMSRVQQSMVQFQPQHSMVAPVVVSQQTVPQNELPQAINKQSQLANEQNEGRKTFTNPVGMPNLDSTVFRQEQKSPEDTVVPGVSASQLYSTPHHQATNPIMQPDIPNLSDVLKATLSRNPRRDLADRGIPLDDPVRHKVE
uniref:Uncharacterized protein n=1 Tax=Sphaerodactylus townsendi TaxID=933632 RepID=A0ACB8EQA7_9SAUR